MEKDPAARWVPIHPGQDHMKRVALQSRGIRPLQVYLRED